MSMTRTFIAVEVSEAVRARAAELISRLRGETKVSWVAPANMHITLKFLGDQTGRGGGSDLSGGAGGSRVRRPV